MTRDSFMKNIFKSPQTSIVAVLIIAVAFGGSKMGIDNELIKYVIGVISGGMLLASKDPNQ